MKPDIKWLDQPDVFRMNQLPPHSDHKFYENEEDYNSGEMNHGQSNLEQNLNGIWKFKYSENSNSRPCTFYKPETDLSDYADIKVPSHIELEGFDKIHYINTKYPWDGHVYRRPPHFQEGYTGEGMFSEAQYNPVGSYVCTFDLEETLQDKKIHICFEGVEQAMYVWLNGMFVGYAEDSFTISEFDLSPYVQKKDNYLAVEVHKRSTAAFLEDQDFFRFFGIFRDVKLYGIPKAHIEDLWIKPRYQIDTQSGSVELILKNTLEIKDGFIQCAILKDSHVLWEIRKDLEEHIIIDDIVLPHVVPWEYENPYLYTFLAKVYDSNYQLMEVVPYKIGFLYLEMIHQVMHLNGKRLIINGMNRHEWSAEHGRAITEIEEAQDMHCIQANHINAIRTSHYPNRISWYHLCDEKGIYLMAETNLETHGSWQKKGAIEPSWNLPGNLSKWESVVLDRARTNFHMFKNHVSILFWSLGNESYAGDVLVKMNAYFKEMDDHRFVHYEGVFWKEEYKASISDMESHMYSSPAVIEAYLQDNPKKPFVLCEYMHDMGNSLGGLNAYMELLDKYEMYQGGFIWDFIDQALFVEDEVTGNKVLRYGGDFDDRPSDYEFSGNGILFADRTEKPALQELRYFYEKYK